MSLAKLSLLTVVVGYLVVFTMAQGTQDVVLEAGNVIGQAVEFFNECGERDVTYCLKERALKYLDSTSGNIELVEGITLKETNPEKDETQNLSNPSLPDEPRARENAIDSLLMDRLTKFLSSHTLEFKLPNSAVSEMKREMDADEGIPPNFGSFDSSPSFEDFCPMCMMMMNKKNEKKSSWHMIYNLINMFELN